MNNVEILAQPLTSIEVTQPDTPISLDLVLGNQISIDLNLALLGPQGPSGLSDIFFLRRVANADLGGHRAVISNLDGTIDYADSSNLLHLGKLLGIIVQAVLQGEEVDVIRGGLLEFEGWNWDVDLPVYLAENGLLTQNPATSGFSQIVGFAQSPTGLFVNLREPILLT
jgi:hypothetical protein